jgi:Ni/Fe-hydrogenase subunit HybB-like protein
MASAAEAFGVKTLKPLARIGVLSAAACVLVAAMTILPDLGKPARIYNLVIHPNWSCASWPNGRRHLSHSRRCRAASNRYI